MEEPKQGKWGLWYVDTVGFATKEEAQAYIARGGKHYSAPADSLPTSSEPKTILGYPKSQWIAAVVIGAFIFGAVMWARSGPKQQTQRVGREFASMQQCLKFIADDVGEKLNAISDKPGDISGKTVASGLFFRCETTLTGTRGPVLEGRWDRLKN